MSGFRLTPATQRDLSAIWDFTAERWSARQAEICVVEVREAIERIATQPERGRRRDEVREGYRSDAVGSHRIFFVERTETVDVIRILHERMDPDRHM